MRKRLDHWPRHFSSTIKPNNRYNDGHPTSFPRVKPWNDVLRPREWRARVHTRHWEKGIRARGHFPTSLNLTRGRDISISQKISISFPSQLQFKLWIFGVVICTVRSGVANKYDFFNTYKSRLGGGGRGGASFSAPGFVLRFFLSSFFNFSFGSDPMKRSL